MLELRDVHTYYGNSYILQGISLEVKAGSVVALLGRNGMGKTTTIRTIMGLNPPQRGEILFKGRKINGLRPYQIARLGIGVVPQGRQIFPSLSVQENLTIGARIRRHDNDWTLGRVYDTFPILKQRSQFRGTMLSGGEQQMLTIARALMTNPDLILMDEPSEGLAPIIVQNIIDIISQLKQSGFSILLVEQNIAMALSLANYVYILSKGVIVHECKPEELINNQEIMSTHLGF